MARRKRKSRPSFVRGALARTPLPLHLPPTGELVVPPLLAPDEGVTVSMVSESPSAGLGTGDEKLPPAVPSASGSVGMTPWDLLDRWLPRYEWLWYVFPPTLAYTAAIFSGNLKTWKEFGLTTLAAVTLDLIVGLAKRK